METEFSRLRNTLSRKDQADLVRRQKRWEAHYVDECWRSEKRRWNKDDPTDHWDSTASLAGMLVAGCLTDAINNRIDALRSIRRR